MSLRQPLGTFCIDALTKLASMGELPYPRWRSPVIAGDPYLTYQLSRLDSHAALQTEVAPEI